MVKLVARLPDTAVGKHMGLQWTRAATSAGANYEEGRAASSRDDFAHKVGIAAKEAREARYWTRTVHAAALIDEDLTALSQEADELAAIVFASARTARKKRGTGSGQ